MYIRITRDDSNLFLIGLYRLKGKWMIMVPGYIVDFPGKEVPVGKDMPIQQNGVHS